MPTGRSNRHIGAGPPRAFASLEYVHCTHPTPIRLTAVRYRLAELRVGLNPHNPRSNNTAARYVAPVEEALPLVPFGRAAADTWARRFVELRRAGKLPASETFLSLLPPSQAGTPL